jgi:hypothetical protein
VRGRAGQLKIPITPQKRAKDGEGEAEVTDNDAPPDIPDVHVNFDAPAILRKWPSLNNQRRTEGTGPTARWVTASGSSWPSRLPCDTYMRFMLHRSPRWWVSSCREISSPNPSGFGIFSDDPSAFAASHRVGRVAALGANCDTQSVVACRCPARCASIADARTYPPSLSRTPGLLARLFRRCSPQHNALRSGDITFFDVTSL